MPKADAVSTTGMRPLLKDRVVLVTGAATGIGEAVARLAAEEGALVMVHDVNEDGARNVAESIGPEMGVVIADLIDDDAPTRIIAETISHFGRLDGLVNNAADTSRSNPDTEDPGHFDRIIRVNVRAPLFLTLAARPHFKAQGAGVVVNVGSINAYSGEPDLLAYSVSKGALATMTRNLGDTLAREGIRVNQINPGWTLTPNERLLKRQQLGPDWESRLPSYHAPSGRLIRPEEIAAHVVFWLSDAAGPVSGSVFEVEQYPFIGRNPDKSGSTD